jgi:hypothetical protein
MVKFKRLSPFDSAKNADISLQIGSCDGTKRQILTTSWMTDLDGNAVALIAVDAVYDKIGIQLAWWYGDHIRNSKGQVVLFVSRSKIDGLMMSAEKPTPRAPTLRVPLGRPNFERLGVKPAKMHEWADITSLPFRDRRRRTLAQLKRALDLAAESRSRTGKTSSDEL